VLNGKFRKFKDRTARGSLARNLRARRSLRLTLIDADQHGLGFVRGVVANDGAYLFYQEEGISANFQLRKLSISQSSNSADFQLLSDYRIPTPPYKPVCVCVCFGTCLCCCIYMSHTNTHTHTHTQTHTHTHLVLVLYACAYAFACMCCCVCVMFQASLVGVLICLCICAHACVCVCPYCNVGDKLGACSRC